MSIEAKIVKCPQCRKPTKYTEKNPYRPFCCERCRTFDRASWAEEEYKIPSNKTDNFEDGSD